LRHSSTRARLLAVSAVAGLLAIAAGTGGKQAVAPPVGKAAGPAGAWESLEPGLELGTFESPRPSAIGDSKVRALRIDPNRFDLRLVNASAHDDRASHSAREWCRREGLVAAINASMYQQDHVTSVSLMRTRRHVNNSRLSKDMSLLALDPLDEEAPPVRIIDRECDDLDAWKPRYGTLVQSIRMISCKGENVWTQQPRRWSTAAIGVDTAGRALFIHSRSPYSTHDFIEILRALPLHLDRALYSEGGPEAQLFVAAGGREMEFLGSFESAFNENDDVTMAWPVPNVVGVIRRAPTPE